MMDLDSRHIVDERYIGKYEAARSGFFSLLVPSDRLNDKVKMPGIDQVADGKLDNLPGNAAEILKLNVVKAPVPHFELGVLEYKRGNETVKFAGTPTFSTGSITVDDVVGLDTKSILMAWQALAYNVKTRKGGRMKDYKIDCQLVEYTQDFTIVRTWDIFGCWIQSLSEGEFDKENDGKRQITANIQYDYAVMSIGDEVVNNRD
jgi:hypothetical protein